MDRKPYREFVIVAQPQQIGVDGSWTLHILIERHREGVHVNEYATGNTYGSHEDAVEQCFAFGQRVIDGEIPGCEAP